MTSRLPVTYGTRLCVYDLRYVNETVDRLKLRDLVIHYASLGQGDKLASSMHNMQLQ